MPGKLVSLLLGSLLLTGLSSLSACMSRTVTEQLDPTAQEQVKALSANFITQMATGNRAEFLKLASLPFWADSWITEVQELADEFPGAIAGESPNLAKLMVKLYPLSELEYLHPQAWEQLKDSQPEYLKDLYLAAVAFTATEGANPEHGFLLVRKQAGKWTLAGLLED